MNILDILPQRTAPRRYVGALAEHGRTREVSVGRMFVRVDDTTLIGVDLEDYRNGGLP